MCMAQALGVFRTDNYLGNNVCPWRADSMGRVQRVVAA